MPRASAEMKSAIKNGQRRLRGNEVHKDKRVTCADSPALEGAFFEAALCKLSSGSCDSDWDGRRSTEYSCAAKIPARVVSSSDHA